MRTEYGEVPEDDIAALEYKLDWYLRYGKLPSLERRSGEEAKRDYGVQYERYIGYMFASHGYSIEHRGLRDGLRDGGIDLVARASRKIRLVQCKRWQKSVDSDVISRLHGAVERFRWEVFGAKLDTCRTDVRGVLMTSGEILPEARVLAKHLGLLVQSRVAYQRYPAVKAQRITADAGRFLLPFTPGYDRMAMRFQNGDRFFWKVREAVAANFFYPQYHQEILRGIRTGRKER